MGRTKQSGFSSARLLETLPPLNKATRLWVAYSGGCDSHVLLHALASVRAQLPVTLKAVHVDHGLHSQSSRWAAHCRAVCDDLGVDFTVLRAAAKPAAGESPEAAARQARYAALECLMESGDLLCTAHHQDDQAETLLLQLFRGAGPKGMAAMPRVGVLGPARMIRPLLSFDRQALRQYATTQGLVWIEDPSNLNTAYYRNYLRHRVMPVLRECWPALNRLVSRSASHCGEAAALLDELAQIDLAATVGVEPSRLVVERLLELSIARQKNLLRFWLHGLGFTLPSETKLQHVLSDVLVAAPDAVPCVSWSGVEIRRFRGSLYALKAVAAGMMDRCIPIELRKGEQQAIPLPDGSFIELEPGSGPGCLSLTKLQQAPLTLRFRQGGESIQPAGRSHHHSLKKLLQEAAIAPWLRSRQPLLYVGEELVAVVNLCISDGWVAREDEAGVAMVWRSSEACSVSLARLIYQPPQADGGKVGRGTDDGKV